MLATHSFRPPRFEKDAALDARQKAIDAAFLDSLMALNFAERPTEQAYSIRTSLGWGLTTSVSRKVRELRRLSHDSFVCQDCARTQRFHAIRVIFDRKADSSIYWKR
jgi:hypothetical protein